MKFLFIISLFLISNTATGQFSDNFSDGELLSDPQWFGDVDQFIVNSNLQLNLNDNEAGESFIYTQYNTLDSFQLELTYEMDFNPSASNFLRIYFALDTPDIQVANGLFLQFGENGSNDAVEIYQLTNGVETLMARGMDGNLATDPSTGKLQVILRNGSEYSLSIDYDRQGVFAKEAVWQNSLENEDYKFFAIYCVYTATRIDKFIFDDISLSAYSPDITPPSLEKVMVTGQSEVAMFFNEPIEPSSVNPLNIFINNNIGFALTAIADSQNPNQINATFDEQFGGGPTYQLTISNIADLSGNFLQENQLSFMYAEPAKEGDLLVSEILFDPYINGSDFVEIYNITDRLLSTQGLKFINQDKEEEKLLPEIEVLPGQYVAFTEDVESLIAIYNPITVNNNIIQMDLPSFNNDSGNVTLSKNDENWKESFDYKEEYHNILLDDTEGVSLERISFTTEVHNQDNWFSSSSTNAFATPGYENSNNISLNINQGIQLESSKFSPNGDGILDEMRLIYKLEEPGGLLNLDVFNNNGFKVKSLADSKTLGTEGVIIWDGTGDDGILENLGIYIIIGNILYPNGDMIGIKNAISLVDFMK